MPFDKADFQVNAPAIDTSLDALIAWLEKQPADKDYCPVSSATCLLAQWLPIAVGKSVRPMFIPGSAVAYEATDKSWRLVTQDFDRVIFDDEDGETLKGETFGAALARARALRESQS